MYALFHSTTCFLLFIPLTPKAPLYYFRPGKRFRFFVKLGIPVSIEEGVVLSESPLNFLKDTNCK